MCRGRADPADTVFRGLNNVVFSVIYVCLWSVKYLFKARLQTVISRAETRLGIRDSRGMRRAMGSCRVGAQGRCPRGFRADKGTREDERMKQISRVIRRRVCSD